jgi:Fe2+ transport system protein FeoA
VPGITIEVKKIAPSGQSIDIVTDDRYLTLSSDEVKSIFVEAI